MGLMVKNFEVLGTTYDAPFAAVWLTIFNWSYSTNSWIVRLKVFLLLKGLKTLATTGRRCDVGAVGQQASFRHHL